MDAKAQSALDLKKQNLKDETKKRKELVKNMEEVKNNNNYNNLVKNTQFVAVLPHDLQFHCKLY